MRRGALLLLAAGFAVTLLPGPWGDEQVTDLPIYRGYAEAFLDGRLPYRDIGFEYPPLAAPLITLPGLVDLDYDGYRLAYGMLALLLAGAVVLLIGALAQRTDGDRGTALIAAALAPLACGAMLRTHFDLAPIALLLGALLALCSGRPRIGLALIGVGAVTKAFPLLAAPVAVAWLVARGERRTALEGSVALGLVMLVVAGGAFVLGPDGARDAVSYQTDRPVQIESTASMLVLGLDAVGLGDARGVVSHRSDGIEHPAAGMVTALLVAGLIAFVVAMTLVAAGRGSPRMLVLACLGTAVAYAALGKVLSPQFLIWVVPLAALAWAWRMWALAGVATAAVLLTFAEFPAFYEDVVARAPAALLLVAARDLLLLAALALIVRALVSDGRSLSGSAVLAPAAAGSTSPGRRRRPRPAPR